MNQEEHISNERPVKDSPPFGGVGGGFAFLGTSTSNGAPVLGCSCDICKNKDPCDNRLCTSALSETAKIRIVIDSGPDFRQQTLPQPFRKIDGLLITHIHYDHVGGIDDVRPYCASGNIEVYTNENTCDGLRHDLPYCFTDNPYPGVPKLNLRSIQPYVKFMIGGIEVMPISVMHGGLPILGYRFRKLVYITDMKAIKGEEFPYLEGVETLTVNTLRWEREYHPHQSISEAIDFNRKIGAKRTYLIHLTHRIGLHEEAQKLLSDDTFFAYDGLKIHV